MREIIVSIGLQVPDEKVEEVLATMRALNDDPMADSLGRWLANIGLYVRGGYHIDRVSSVSAEMVE